MTSLSRREFLAASAAAASAAAASAAGVAALPMPLHASPPKPLVVIDTHTHFYDPSRKEGVPWPPKESPLYRTVLPKHYRAERTPSPVTGTVVVEASEWVEDNQWILDLAKDDPFIVGFVGRLPIREERFGKLLERFAENELFRGIRVRSQDVVDACDDADLRKRFAQLEERNFSVDVLGDWPYLEAVKQLARKLPRLKFVIDHMARPVLEIERTSKTDDWERQTALLGPRENVSCKVSGLVEAATRTQNAAPAPTKVEFYEPTLDHLWKVFGEDRVIYGSNWPVCERGGSLFTVQQLATEYFSTKGAQALAKYLAGNAKSVYGWISRQ